MEDIDQCNEWLIGKMGSHCNDETEDELMFDGDDLTWGTVASAASVGEGKKNTRSQARSTPSSSQTIFEKEEEAHTDERRCGRRISI